EDEVRGNLEHCVAEEKNSSAEAVLGRREPQILVHGEGGDADIGAVEIIDHIGEGEKWHHPPGDLLEHRFLLRIHRTVPPKSRIQVYVGGRYDPGKECDTSAGGRAFMRASSHLPFVPSVMLSLIGQCPKRCQRWEMPHEPRSSGTRNAVASH